MHVCERLFTQIYCDSFFFGLQWTVASFFYERVSCFEIRARGTRQLANIGRAFREGGRTSDLHECNARFFRVTAVVREPLGLR